MVGPLSAALPKISVSIASHNQAILVKELLADMDRLCGTYPLEVLLTLNQPELLPFDTDNYSFPVAVYQNLAPKGFADNHNQAFAHAAGEFFCVMNPDIRINEDPFPNLLACLEDTCVGVAAPLVIGKNGEIEDSARSFPTPVKILCKALGGCKGSDYVVKKEIMFPDWVAGMFLLFRRDTFEQIGGFDQRYFLYYEDVDLCARLRLRGYEIALCTEAKVIHHAHRSSHRNIKYLKLHLASMLRFFFSPPFFKICMLRLRKQKI